MKDQNKTNDPAKEPINEKDLLNLKALAKKHGTRATFTKSTVHSTHIPEFTIIPENKPATMKDVLHVLQILHEKDILTKEEYESEKEKLLN